MLGVLLGYFFINDVKTFCLLAPLLVLRMRISSPITTTCLPLYLEKQLKDKQFKEEWDKLEPEYKLIESLIVARLKKGLTQEKLAERINTKQESISRVESGKVVPTIPFLKRIAQALDSRLEIRLSY